MPDRTPTRNASTPDPYAAPRTKQAGARRRTASSLTDDALAGPYRVLQRRRGHRYSLDDVATAFIAAHACPDADSVLDLGAGLGSVLLMLAYKLPHARLGAIEAQRLSYSLLRRNLLRNYLERRCQTRLADLRAPRVLEELAQDLGCTAGFRLITGTPPYQPVGQGPISPDPQRAHARVELRGGVEDYLEAAARVLHPEGRVVMCADARRPERIARGAASAGLRVLEQTDVVPIAGHKGALFSVFVLYRPANSDAPRQQLRRPELVARDHHGARTPQSRELRRFFDLPVDEGEAPSPRVRARRQAAAG